MEKSLSSVFCELLVDISWSLSSQGSSNSSDTTILSSNEPPEVKLQQCIIHTSTNDFLVTHSSLKDLPRDDFSLLRSSHYFIINFFIKNPCLKHGLDGSSTESIFSLPFLELHGELG